MATAGVCELCSLLAVFRFDNAIEGLITAIEGLITAIEGSIQYLTQQKCVWKHNVDICKIAFFC